VIWHNGIVSGGAAETPQPGNPLGADRQDAEVLVCPTDRRFVNLTLAAQHGVFARAFTRKTLKIALFKSVRNHLHSQLHGARVFRMISSPVVVDFIK
jgi:hypothetical protein